MWPEKIQVRLAFLAKAYTQGLGLSGLRVWIEALGGFAFADLEGCMGFAEI